MSENTVRHPAQAVGLWRHYPWMLGLALAPILFGSVTTEGQVFAGLSFALSLLLLAGNLGGGRMAVLPASLVLLAWFWLLLPLIPLPFDTIQWLSPWRATLARQFPVAIGETPAWLTLSVSPVNTIQRLWELGLVIAAFDLARQASRQPQFGQRLALILAVVLLVEVASDLWYRTTDQRVILGLWEISWGVGAGTFANRNHFAHWVCVAALFVLGGVWRNLTPFQSVRKQPLPRGERSRVLAWFLLVTVLVAMAAAVACGSRGGVVVLGGGAMTWLVVLIKRSQDQRRLALIAFGGLAAFILLFLAGELAISRLAEVDASYLERYPKFQIWRQTWALCLKFPGFGLGWGGFITAFNHFKTGWEDSTCWHAENDYLQLVAEGGLLGALVCGGAVGGLVLAGIRYARAPVLAEPEYVLGAVAALVAFAIGAGFEFVFQITANALLAAALLGFLLGQRDAAKAPIAPPPLSNRRWLMNLTAAFLLAGAALSQGFAFWHWRRAERARSPVTTMVHLQESLRFWPWASNRQIAMLRQEMLAAKQSSKSERLLLGERFHAQADRALRWDPLNWELRLERVWLDFAFSTNVTRTLAEAHEVARLNPRQPKIPLGFARVLAPRRPDLARQFLQAVDRADPRWLREALLLAWQMEQDTKQLWLLAPNSVPGLTTLGDFALEQRLYPLAAQAFSLLTNRLPTFALAEKFLAAQRPDLVLSTLAGDRPSGARSLLLCRAHYAAGAFPEVVRIVEELALASRSRAACLPAQPVAEDLVELRARWQTKPDDLARAQRLAEKLFGQPARERDSRLLRQLAAGFPEDPRLAWIQFKTEDELGADQSAATIGLNLAARLLALEGTASDQPRNAVRR